MSAGTRPITRAELKALSELAETGRSLHGERFKDLMAYVEGLGVVVRGARSYHAIMCARCRAGGEPCDFGKLLKGFNVTEAE